MKENKELEHVLTFLKNKTFQNILAIVILLIIIIVGVSLRMETLPNLMDETTNDYTPLALDPYYFLRVAETIVEHNGTLPEVDSFRYVPGTVSWTNQILPFTTVWIHKTIAFFGGNQTLNYAAVINPVVFFVLGLIVFFTLVWFLTKNKWVATGSSLILSFIPPYLYRTLVGFADHDSIGMFGFFLAILSFSFGLIYLNKEKKKIWISALIGIVSGFFTMFALTSWDGAAKFLFMILPLAFLVNWLINNKKNDWHGVTFYGTFILGILIFAPLFRYTVMGVLKANMLGLTGILTLFVLGYSVVDLIIRKSKKLPKFIKKYPEISSIIIVILFAMIFYQSAIGNIFTFFGNILHSLLHPFGTNRVSLTVAENSQPYLTTLISQIGKPMFYIFLLGCFFVGGNLAKGIEIKKYRAYFIGAIVFFIVGLLFSRYSSSAIFDGTNLFSKIIFILSFVVFLVTTIFVYSKSKWHVDTRWIIIAAWMIPMLIAVRSASRVLFLIVPFVSMMIPLALLEIFKWGKRNKDATLKIGSFILVGVLSIILLFSVISQYKDDKISAKYQTPDYDSNWQNAMSWVRENTPKDSIFLHWWDYGYWVQTGGNRNSIVDGGFHPDYLVHNIGRYVLTTPYPETAKSYVKTMEADYLLIDPTDIGKYSAYSSIGNDNDTPDRGSYLVTFASDPTQITETRNGTTRIYQGGIYLDEDLIFNNGSNKILLPKGKAVVMGIIFEINSEAKPNQPKGVYVYNNKQYYLPIRYLYIENTLVDFGGGINSTAYVYPLVYSVSNTQKVDEYGAAIYLSEKVKDSLVVQLYLMNDPDELYNEFELVHEESQYPFSFYYGSYQGPIKIYKINRDEMTNILVRDEFKEEWSGDANPEKYGSFDDLEFVKN